MVLEKTGKNLLLNPNNPQKFNDLAKLQNSIKEFPKMLELRPLVYDPKTMYVLGGNKRLICLKELGYKEIPVKWTKVATKLSKDEIQRFIIADNVSFGEWDFDLLDGWESDKLEEWGVDLSEFESVKVKEEDDYSIPEEIETNIKIGDLFKIGNHHLICGDATNQVDCKKLLDGQKADMVFTDPPFDFDFDFDFDICNGHIFYMNSEKNLINFTIKHIDVFSRLYTVDFRNAHLISNKSPMSRCDYVAEFLNGKNKFNNLKDGFSTLIESSKGVFMTDDFGHKQAKKVSLPSTFIEHYTNKGENVLDYFGGSGSTMAACEQLNRKCYMIEIEPKNCQIIINRMKEVYNIDSVLIN
ncbi:MAG: DNA modification methylase [Bacteroidetes bacterium]|jgi:16S rRNA G966 N2-methylase RsmD|nr:DNA modification methylase [Bacteroidota bacterium]MBT7492861.1 DNA modification methylase [Bacteroidota bacterium]